MSEIELTRISSSSDQAPFTPPFPRSIRVASIVGSYAIAWVTFHEISRTFWLPSNISSWYPPSALSIVLVLCFGPRYIPALFLGPFLSDLWEHFSILHPVHDFIYSLIEIVGYGGVALVLRNIVHIDTSLRKGRDFVIFFAVTTLVASPIVAVLYVGQLLAEGTIAATAYTKTALNLWLGDSTGIIVFAPVMLICIIPATHAKIRFDRNLAHLLRALHRLWAQHKHTILETCAQAVTVIFLLWLTTEVETRFEIDLIDLYFLPIVWIALRRGLFGAAIGIVLADIAAVFAVSTLTVDQQYTFNFQLFMLAVSMTALLIGRVVDERSRVQTAFRDSEERYRLLFEVNPHPMWVYDRETLRFLAVNAATVQHYGYSAEEFLSKSITDMRPQQDVPRFLNHPAKDQMAYTDTGIWRHIKKDGTLIQVEVAAQALAFDGHPAKVVLATDVTERVRTEDALRRSEELYRTLARNFPNSTVMLFDHDLRCILIEGQGLEERGYTKQNTEGQSLLELLGPYIGVNAQSIFQAALTGTSTTLEVPYEDQIYMVSIVPVKKEGDEIFAGMLVAQNITERKRAEESLRKSEATNRALLDALPDRIFRHSAQGIVLDYRITRKNGLRSTAFEQFIGTHLTNILPTPIADKIMESTRLALAGSGVQTLEYSLPYKGKAHVYEARLAMSGEAEVLVVVRDITERKQAADALAAEKERLAVTLYSIGDGVITTDTQGHIVLLNRVAEKLTGWSQAEAEGQPFHTIFCIKNMRTEMPTSNPVAQVMQSGGIVTLADDIALIAKDGTLRLISDSGAPIHDPNGNIIGVVLVFRDITNERRIEEERQRVQKLESVGILAGGIAHDFNNILTGIVGNLALARAEVDDNPHAVNLLEEAENAAFRVRSLTQQLLTFSQGGEPIRKTAALDELLREASSFALRGARARFSLTIADDLRLVTMDAGQINQVIHNLLINAEQAMPNGGIIRITAVNVAAADLDPALPLTPGDYVRVTVADEGSGIARENLSRVFDPYFTTKRSGSGLGLASTFSILAKHGGCITVTSELDQGTTFAFYLPASSQSSRTATPRLPPKFEGQGRILIMDDEASIRVLVCKALERIGYKVDTAEDGTTALALYQAAFDLNQPYSVVIMDLTIPNGMGGKEAIQHLRQIDPNVRAIVSSGYSTDPIMAHYKNYGFDGVLTKPFKIAELREKVFELIGVPTL